MDEDEDEDPLDAFMAAAVLPQVCVCPSYVCTSELPLPSHVAGFNQHPSCMAIVYCHTVGLHMVEKCYEKAAVPSSSTPALDTRS
jgi:hypothetical protein